jgi:dUTPase
MIWFFLPKLKLSVFLLAGVIDADYRGNIGVVLFNFSDSDFTSKI